MRDFAIDIAIPLNIACTEVVFSYNTFNRIYGSQSETIHYP